MSVFHASKPTSSDSSSDMTTETEEERENLRRT
jgi:hypothetical protein